MRSITAPLNNERGVITIELAIGLAALILTLGMVVAGLATMAAYISAVDIAGAAARAYAVGESFEPPRGSIEIAERNGMVHIRATVPAPLGTMEAQAQYPVQYRLQ
ncbi:MAG: hypothetical protein Q3976_02800 [Corynebacterium sp.]|nr:hypothetical protein [Corynebacterium sp.]